MSESFIVFPLLGWPVHSITTVFTVSTSAGLKP